MLLEVRARPCSFSSSWGLLSSFACPPSRRPTCAVLPPPSPPRVCLTSASVTSPPLTRALLPPFSTQTIQDHFWSQDSASHSCKAALAVGGHTFPSQGLRRGHFREPHSAYHTHSPGPAGMQIRQTISAPLWEGSWSVQNPRTQGSAPKPSARPMGSVWLGKEAEVG